MNKRGFTLVELLVAMVILGILSAVAVPNVIGILNNSKNSVYVEDAKKFISMVEYKVRSDSTVKLAPSGFVTIVALSYVDNSEFEHAPNGGEYDKERSRVYIYNNAGTYEYYVALVENVNGYGRGVYKVPYEILYTAKPNEIVLSATEKDIKNGMKRACRIPIDYGADQVKFEKYSGFKIENGQVKKIVDTSLQPKARFRDDTGKAYVYSANEGESKCPKEE